jgi:branched-chain amino acid transport system ATP-binding protein
LLRLNKLTIAYGDVVVVKDLSMQIERGKIVCLIGANGAGKTTTLKTISGLLRAQSGTILFNGEEIHKQQSHKIVEAGLVQVPEGRKLFSGLSVQENLELGSYVKKAKGHRAESLQQVYGRFPRLAERKKQKAGTLSGGEQQMLAVGRALMTRPSLLMLDEPSLGLAPMLVSDIFQAVKEINEAGTTILIVEQNAVQTLKMSDKGYVLENGNIVLSGTGSDLLKDDRIRSAYLGI